MLRKQRLVTVRVETGESGEQITLADGGSLEELLTRWRIVQMEGLGAQGDAHTALLLLEELPPESRGGRLGFGVEPE